MKNKKQITVLKGQKLLTGKRSGTRKQNKAKKKKTVRLALVLTYN